ncbi:GNAT family N-acetyltransferase [Streptomyces sp. B6B3]|uniref:GNAT family N-acetyltransferase n=1 Tax=Streptomyces sp. B6B3 TaxID=3153570 RepID=UPI00325E7EE5
MFIEERTPDDPGLARLLAAAFAELVARYGPRGRSDVLPDARYLVAVVEGEAAGCVALQPTPDDPATGEVKRMYVMPEARGRGLARGLLAELETLARQLGYRRLRLATGMRQGPATALYESFGFTPTPRYGRYLSESRVVACYAKPLTGVSPR